MSRADTWEWEVHNKTSNSTVGRGECATLMEAMDAADRCAARDGWWRLRLTVTHRNDGIPGWLRYGPPGGGQSTQWTSVTLTPVASPAK